MAEENRKKLPYLAPLARVIPLVYDESISYYEFLNKLYQAVEEILDDELELQQAMDELRALVESYNSRINKAQTDADAAKEGVTIEVARAMGKEEEIRASLQQQLNGLSNDVGASWLNMVKEFGGSSAGRQYAPNLLDCKKLYKGPGTLSETKGDIPALAGFIDDTAAALREEITDLSDETQTSFEVVNGKLDGALNDIINLKEGKHFRYRENTLGTSIDIGEMLSEELGITKVRELMGKNITVALAIATSATSSAGTSYLKLDDTTAGQCPLLKPETQTAVRGTTLTIDINFYGIPETDEVFVEYKPHYSGATSRLFGGLNVTSNLGYNSDIFLKLDMTGFDASTSAQTLIFMD